MYIESLDELRRLDPLRSVRMNTQLTPTGMENTILFNLRKFLVPEIVYGSGSIKLAGRHAINFGASKALVVTDPGVRKSGWAEKVERSLVDAGIRNATFSEISSNPRDFESCPVRECFCGIGVI